VETAKEKLKIMSATIADKDQGNQRLICSVSPPTRHNCTHRINPHIHFLVPGGGIALDGQSWITCRPGFFLPVQVLSRMFRGLFLHYLEKAFTAGELNFFAAHHNLNEPAAFRRHLAPAWNANWVVYAKRPFAGPAQVLDYVGRYTHRVAISNNRLVSMDDGTVSFRWKDYVRREGAGG
jgi:hypothetical protein